MDENGKAGQKGKNDITKTPPPEVVDDTIGPCDVTPPTPPDGGYGWVIMFASFMINVIVDGVCFSFGIFFLEFLDYFGESKSKTSWVGSVLNGMYLSMGPIVAALAHRFGCRMVAIVGSIIACIAYILAAFSPNVNILILTYGALGGAGFGLMYLPAIVMVGHYFERYRALATGVAVCGSGIGAFIFAPLTEFLISYYGWKGATIILAGLTLQGVVMGALFRPLESYCRPVKQVPKSCEELKAAAQEPYDKGDNLLYSSMVNEDDIKAKFISEYLPKDIFTNVETGIENNDYLLNQPPNRHKKSRIQSMENLHQTRIIPSNNMNAKLSMSCDHAVFPKKCASLPDIDAGQRVRYLRRPVYRKDIFYSGSVMNLPACRAELNETTRSLTSIAQKSSESRDSTCFGSVLAMVKTLGTLMDFSLMKNPVFAVYGFSCFLCMTGFFVPFMYLPDDAILKGIKRGNAAFLLSIIGVANTVARVLCGWVSDRAWADCLLINNMALIVGGIATILAPFCTVYSMMVLYAATFGSAIAVFVSLRSILMVELIGLDKLNNAFGLVTFCQGLSAFIGAPIAGALFDATGSYHISFYFAGTTLLLAGLICLPLRRVARWHKARTLNQAKMDKTSM